MNDELEKQLIKVAEISFDAGVQSVIDTIEISSKIINLNQMTAKQFSEHLISIIGDANARNNTDAH